MPSRTRTTGSRSACRAAAHPARLEPRARADAERQLELEADLGADRRRRGLLERVDQRIQQVVRDVPFVGQADPVAARPADHVEPELERAVAIAEHALDAELQL